MDNNVYFSDLRSRNSRENKVNKIRKLFDQNGFHKIVERNGLTAVKLHFGEEIGRAHV